MNSNRKWIPFGVKILIRVRALSDNHDQMFQGKMVKVSHICRKCFSKKREKNKHKEIGNVSPFQE